MKPALRLPNFRPVTMPVTGSREKRAQRDSMFCS